VFFYLFVIYQKKENMRDNIEEDLNMENSFSRVQVKDMAIVYCKKNTIICIGGDYFMALQTSN
jgi:hypothetical protein